MSDAINPTAPAVRASDAERDRVAGFLKRQTAAGRLTLAELEQRIGAAYSARTREQLQALIADLPADADGALGPATVPDSQPRLSSPWYGCPPAALFYRLFRCCASRTAPLVTVNGLERRTHDEWHEAT